MNNRFSLFNGIMPGWFRRNIKLRYLEILAVCGSVAGEAGVDLGRGPGRYAARARTV